MEKCPSSLLIRETEIEITGRYSFICIRMIIVKKTENQKIATVGKDIDKLETARIAGRDIKLCSRTRGQLCGPAKS